MKLIDILSSDLSPEASFTLLQLQHRRVQSLDDATRTLVGLGELVDRGIVRLTIDISTTGDHRKENRVNILRGVHESPSLDLDNPPQTTRQAPPVPSVSFEAKDRRETPSEGSPLKPKPKRSEVVAKMESSLKKFEKTGRKKPKPEKVVPEIMRDSDVENGVIWIFKAINTVRVSVGISELPDHLSPMKSVEHLLGVALFCLKHSVDPVDFIEVLYRETRWQNNSFPSLSTLAGDWAQGTFWSNRPSDTQGRLKPTADARVSMDERQSANVPRRILKGIVEDGQEPFHYQRAEALLDSPAELLDELERTHRTSPSEATKLIEIVRAVASHNKTPDWFEDVIRTYKNKTGAPSDV